jgi:hypothetical protein
MSVAFLSTTFVPELFGPCKHFASHDERKACRCRRAGTLLLPDFNQNLRPASVAPGGACSPACCTCLTLVSACAHAPLVHSLQSERRHHGALSGCKRHRPRWNPQYRTRHAYYFSELRAAICENQHRAKLSRTAHLVAGFTGCTPIQHAVLQRSFVCSHKHFQFHFLKLCNKQGYSTHGDTSYSTTVG